MLASALLVLAISADTPGVIRAALDRHLEKKCGTAWATQVTLVSDTAIAPYLGRSSNGPLQFIPEPLVRELARMPGGAWLDLPPMYFPFRAVTSPAPGERGAGGIIHLSVPVFDADASSAVIYIQHYCGELCADGRLLYFQRKPFRWVVVRDVPLWVS